MIKICNIDLKYTSFLSAHEPLIPLEHPGRKQRPYVGAVLQIEQQLYYIPMGSPKPKHVSLPPSLLDIYKIKNGKLGILNINNMIPIPKSIANKILIPVNLKIQKEDSFEDKRYKVLLNRQIIDLRNHESEIIRKANVLHNLYSTNKLTEKIKKRCCNFPQLERLSKFYEKEFTTEFKKTETPVKKTSLNPYKSPKLKFTKISANLFTYSYDKNINAIIQKKNNKYKAKIGYIKDTIEKWTSKINI